MHYDEGITEPVKNRWGAYEKDEQGNLKKVLVQGRAHLHFNFIPVAKDNNTRHEQSEKICANDVLTRTELRSFYGDLDTYLKENDVKGEVYKGITKANGGNYSVGEMKRLTKLEKEMEVLRKQLAKYEQKQGVKWGK